MRTLHMARRHTARWISVLAATPPEPQTLDAAPVNRDRPAEDLVGV